jgi:phosphoribosylformylglycinamidine cyclo-ligase
MSSAYQQSGVDYAMMDPFKKDCQEAGLATAHYLERFGGKEFAPSRGESCYLVEFGDHFIALVEEGLGTKNLVADATRNLLAISDGVFRSTGNVHVYDGIGQDTIAMNVNDMVTLGALPMITAMHLAVGDGAWFKDQARAQALVRGWAKACHKTRCTWGCGETPTLKMNVTTEGTVLSCSAVGMLKPKSRRMGGDRIQDGDRIILLGSSGVHANGLTLVRKIADALPDGYLSRLPDGRTLGEAILQPTHIYVPFIEECFRLGLDLHYGVNVTGHGWAKLLRATQPFRYVLSEIPKPQAEFAFLQERAQLVQDPIDTREMYKTFNMGAGFALYVAEKHAAAVVSHASDFGLTALNAGVIRAADKREVVIEPLDIRPFDETDLQVR